MAEETKVKKSINDDVAALKEVKIGDFMNDAEIKAFIKSLKKYDGLTPETALNVLAKKVVDSKVEFAVVSTWS